MKKLLFILLALPLFIYGQDEEPKISTDFEVGLSTRNVWRGLDYGSSPSVYGDLWAETKFLSVGAMGTTTLNGSKSTYGTWMELYTTFKFGEHIRLTFDDYFFFNSDDTLDNYFDWSRDVTQHYIEARLGYESDKFEAFAGYVLYSNSADSSNGVYLEATYYLNEKISFVAAGLTDANWLSFYDGGGITTLGVNGHKKIKISETFTVPMKASLLFNPNWENGMTVVNRSPVYFVISLTI